MKTKVFNRKKVKISAISSSLPPYLIKNNKGVKKEDVRKDSKLIKTKSYTQILKIKENFPNLSRKKIEEINRVVYD